MADQTSLEIDAIAAAWAARVDRGPLSAADEPALEAWLAADIRHRGAFARMRAIALYTERAKAFGPGLDLGARAAAFDHDAGGDADTSQDHPPAGRAHSRRVASITRRNVIWVGGSAAAACAAGVVGVAIFARARRYETQLGELSVVSLDDGSVITLNTASKIEVRFARALRSVRLIEGEALFDVAKDKARPFIVDTDGATTRAVGTSFAVRRLANAPVTVLVREGVVEVRAPAAPKAVRLGANMLTEIASGSSELRPVELRPDDIDRALAWREGRLAFEGETLGDAAAVFARYSRTRIVIDDPYVRQQEITGLFAANDPISFAKAAALSLDLHADSEAGQVRIRR